MKSSSALVLLSSGLDSSFNLLKTKESFDVRLALTFNYGQKAARSEIAAAKRLADYFQVPFQVVDLPWFSKFTKTSLVAEGQVPKGSQVAIDDAAVSAESAKQVWVPNRNGIFLNIAAGFAEGLGAKVVVPGFNLEEAATFPDNSEAYLKALDAAWKFSTLGRVKTFCHSTHMNKTEIVAEAKALGLPFHLLWPCYLDGEMWCGECESCQRYKRALDANGLSFEELKVKR